MLLFSKVILYVYKNLLYIGYNFAFKYNKFFKMYRL